MGGDLSRDSERGAGWQGLSHNGAKGLPRGGGSPSCMREIQRIQFNSDPGTGPANVAAFDVSCTVKVRRDR
jgi:hypothetical protein